MPQYRVLLTDYAWPDVDIERGLLEEADAELVIAKDTAEDTLKDLAVDVDAILTCWANVTAQVVQAAKRCKIVSRMGIGLDNIDVVACTEQSVIVTNVPDYCVTEVAEHTMALLLSLARNIAFYHHDSKLGSYDRQCGGPMQRLAGRKFGVIGMGRIGSHVAALAQAFDLEVLAIEGRSAANQAGVRYVDLKTLLAECDFVSLHAPLTAETHHMINADSISRMKQGVQIINTARGDLIDHAALAAGLDSGHIRAAALDVQSPEPPDLSTPPYSSPQVIVTPHAAFVSEESVLELRRRSTQQVCDVLAGRQPANIVNGIRS